MVPISLNALPDGDRAPGKYEHPPTGSVLNLECGVERGHREILVIVLKFSGPVFTLILTGLIGSLNSFWSCDTARQPVGLVIL